MPSQPSISNVVAPANEVARSAWEAVLERARRDLPPAAFDMWFSALIPGKVKGQVVELELARRIYVTRDR